VLEVVKVNGNAVKCLCIDVVAHTVFSAAVKGKKKGASTVDSDSSEDESFVDSGEEDIDLEEGSASGDEEVIKNAPPPTVIKRAAKKKAVDTATLTKEFAQMAVQKASFSMEFKCPYIMYDYVVNGRKVVTVDFLVVNQHRRFFRLSVNGGKVLELKIVVPAIFYNSERLSVAHSEAANFDHNTHKSTAFQARCKEIKKSLGVATHDDEAEEFEVSAGKQCIQLPFEVEEQFFSGASVHGTGYEILVMDNDDERLYNELEGEATQFFVLSVDMVHIEKEKARMVGGMRKLKVASPLGRRQADEAAGNVAGNVAGNANDNME
jgi:hypothetical protein